MTTLKRIDGTIIAESETLSFKELVERNKANLSKASLSEANLLEANLSGADLSGADLSSANLSLVNLHWANLYGANLYGVRGLVQFGPVPTSGRIGYAVDHGDKIMVQLGCWWNDLDSTITEIKCVHPNKKGDAYIKMLEASAECLEVKR